MWWLTCKITHVPVAAVLVLYTPDDGRLRPKHVEWPCRNKTCTVLNQVGVSFELSNVLYTFQKFYVLLTLPLDIIVQTKTNLMRNLFLVYFINLYMFRAYLGPSSGIPIQPGQQSSKKNYKYQLLYTYDLPPDDGPRYARNILRLTNYTKGKSCIKLVFLYTTC